MELTEKGNLRYIRIKPVQSEITPEVIGTGSCMSFRTEMWRILKNQMVKRKKKCTEFSYVILKYEKDHKNPQTLSISEMISYIDLEKIIQKIITDIDEFSAVRMTFATQAQSEDQSQFIIVLN